MFQITEVNLISKKLS